MRTPRRSSFMHGTGQDKLYEIWAFFCNICNYIEAGMPTRCSLILALIFFISKWQCAPRASRSNCAYTTNACHLQAVPAIHQPVVVWITVEDALLNISMKMIAKLTVLKVSTKIFVYFLPINVRSHFRCANSHLTMFLITIFKQF